MADACNNVVIEFPPLDFACVRRYVVVQCVCTTRGVYGGFAIVLLTTPRRPLDNRRHIGYCDQLGHFSRQFDESLALDSGDSRMPIGRNLMRGQALQKDSINITILPRPDIESLLYARVNCTSSSQNPFSITCSFF